jgi:predicted flap endonuclease-1-like 5' DNA nuclease
VRRWLGGGLWRQLFRGFVDAGDQALPYYQADSPGTEAAYDEQSLPYYNQSPESVQFQRTQGRAKIRPAPAEEGEFVYSFPPLPSGLQGEYTTQEQTISPAAQTYSPQYQESKPQTPIETSFPSSQAKSKTPKQQQQADQPVEADFTALKGIGPTLDKRLKDGGVHTLQDLIALPPEELGAIIDWSVERVEREDLHGQARRILSPSEGSD